MTIWICIHSFSEGEDLLADIDSQFFSESVSTKNVELTEQPNVPVRQ